jgi:hypothetical protein
LLELIHRPKEYILGDSAGRWELLLQKPIAKAWRIDPRRRPHIVTSKITALEHKLRDDTVEIGTPVAGTLFAFAEFNKIGGRPRNNIIEKLKGNPLRYF